MKKLVYLTLLLVGSLNAVSFDCDKASNAIEKTICSDLNLSKQDDELQRIYQAFKLASSDPKKIKNDQLLWLTQRNKCSSDYENNMTLNECIAKAYQSRIAYLENNSLLSEKCEGSSKTILDEALDLAIRLPQVDGYEQQWDDERWIKTGNYEDEGSYGYLLHDLAIEYAKSECWDDSLRTMQYIHNLGAKDSAYSFVAIEFAKADMPIQSLNLIETIKYKKAGDNARDAVAKELVRHQHFELGRSVLLKIGLLDDHYYSFFYKHTMNLANNGYYDEALKYVSKRDINNIHVNNARGDMILLFLKRNELDYAKKIVDFYENSTTTNLPDNQLAIYYAVTNNFTKADKHIKRITNPQFRVKTYFQIADALLDSPKALEY